MIFDQEINWEIKVIRKLEAKVTTATAKWKMKAVQSNQKNKAILQKALD